MLPKIEVRRLSLPEPTLPTELPNPPDSGVKAGASGLNVGPEVEKLKSLWPGVNTGAATLIFPLPTDGWLKWLEVAEAGGPMEGKAVIGC